MSTTWKDAAIERSDFISDLWEVATVWAGKIALPVLAVGVFLSIYESFPSVHVSEAFKNNLMLVQSGALDMGGLGFLTMGISLWKKGQDSHKSATTSFTIAGALLFIMLLSVGLSVAPNIWPDAASWAPGADKALIFVRIVVSVAYGFLFHLVKGITHDAPAVTPQQQQREDTLAQRIDDLVKIVEATQKGVENAPKGVEITEFEKLASAVYEVMTKLESTQTTVNNILHLHTTLYTSTPPLQPPMHPVEVTQIEENASSGTIDSSVDSTTLEDENDREEATQLRDTDKLKALTIPVLEVPGVSAEKVKQVLTAYLSGTTWRNIKPGNYTQTIKPVKEAYESYLQQSMHLRTDERVTVEV